MEEQAFKYVHISAQNIHLGAATISHACMPRSGHTNEEPLMRNTQTLLWPACVASSLLVMRWESSLQWFSSLIGFGNIELAWFSKEKFTKQARLCSLPASVPSASTDTMLDTGFNLTSSKNVSEICYINNFAITLLSVE